SEFSLYNITIRIGVDIFSHWLTVFIGGFQGGDPPLFLIKNETQHDGSIHLVLYPLTGIDADAVSRRKRSLAGTLIIQPSAFIDIAVGIFHEAFAGTFAIHPLALIYVAVGIVHGSFAILHICHPVARIHIFIAIGHTALAGALAFLPVAVIDASVGIFHT